MTFIIGSIRGIEIKLDVRKELSETGITLVEHVPVSAKGVFSTDEVLPAIAVDCFGCASGKAEFLESHEHAFLCLIVQVLAVNGTDLPAGEDDDPSLLLLKSFVLEWPARLLLGQGWRRLWHVL